MEMDLSTISAQSCWFDYLEARWHQIRIFHKTFCRYFENCDWHCVLASEFPARLWNNWFKMITYVKVHRVEYVSWDSKSYFENKRSNKYVYTDANTDETHILVYSWAQPSVLGTVLWPLCHRTFYSWTTFGLRFYPNISWACQFC